MAKTISYEVYAYKGGKWVIDSVYDDKRQALHEGRTLLESRHLSGVKIIQEDYDNETDKTSAMVIFNETKNIGKVKHKPKKVKSSSPVSTTKAPPHPHKVKKGEFSRIIIKLVLVLGGLMLGGVILIAYYVTAFSQ